MEFPPFEHLHLYERLRGRYLHISYSDMTPFPLEGFRRALPRGIDMNWVDPMGSPELRERIAGRHRVNRDHVLVTTGATEANFLVNAALVRPGDRVLVDTPLYSPLRDCPIGFRARVVPIVRDCRDGWALDLDRLRKMTHRHTRLLVFANLNNPTSAMLTRTDLAELAELAEDRDAHILVDETFRDMGFARAPPSAAGFGPRMIAIGTVSKLYGLGVLRVGWIIADPDLLAAVKRVKDYTTSATPALSQVVATWALRRHAFFVKRAKDITDRNRRVLRDAVERMPSLRGEVPDVGNVFFPHCDVNVTKLEDRLLRKYRTVIAHGRFFGTEDHFRIGLGGPSGVFRRGLENVRKALRELT